MAQFELLLPKMGESVAEATIIKWLKNPGDQISEDEAVIEIATDKVDSEVPSPVSGRLISRMAEVDDVVQVNSVIALIETEDMTASSEDTFVSRTEPVSEPLKEEIPPGLEQLNNKSSHTPVPESRSGARFYSPLVRNIAAAEGLSMDELDNIKGSGAEGRVTKQDVLDHIQNKHLAAVPAARQQVQQADPLTQRSYPVNARPAESQLKQEPSHSPQQHVLSAGDEIIEMDRMRRLISEHMVMSKNVSVHVTSFVEADVTNLVKWRDKIKGPFEKREGEKITFTPVFVQAVTKAIKDFPMINISVNGNQIIKKRDINIGMAAALPNGNLIVPVIKNADQLNLIGLTKSVNDLAKRARANKLQPDEVKDGTFTLTNIGPFGNIMGTPMINQPQVAILAIGTIQKKPAVIETEYGDVIAIRHKMYLSMSYDHRVVDGALGGMFLKRVADYLEGWDINHEL